MSRILRAKLPNGTTVSIDPSSPGPDKPDIDLATEAERLAGLLEIPRIPESELLTFLVNAASTVFHEAEPGQRPAIVTGPNELGADLVFDMRRTDGVGIVQIKGAAPETSRAIDAQLLHLLARPLLGRPVHFMYVIAGRDRNFNRSARQIRRQLANVPMYVLSWDAVVDRLRTVPVEKDGPDFKIVLIEMVNMSRKLLLALASEPRLFSGIDDRKFEELVATLLADLGLQDVELTPPRKDGGKDIIMTHIAPSTGCREVYLMECKHWGVGNKVTMRWAIDLLAVAQQERAAGSILLSSSGFGPRLLEQEATLARQGVFLKDAQDLSGWIGVWQRQYGGILLEPVNPRDILALRE